MISRKKTSRGTVGQRPSKSQTLGAPKQLTAARVKADLRQAADADRAKTSRWFFKTGPGEYSEGDLFLGVTVPQQRKIARAHRGLPLAEITELLASAHHEDRLTGVFLMVDRYQKGTDAEKAEVCQSYLRTKSRINNWDIVDSSAYQILGQQLWQTTGGDPKAILKTLLPLARSKNLWHRRIAVTSTYAFICQGEPGPTLHLAELLLSDREDLIHKASGWMLREVGKRVGLTPLRDFLAQHAPTMPRTMLRYAIEHLPAEQRQRWLSAEASKKKAAVVLK